MTDELEDEFMKIADTAVSEAERVDCAFHTFIGGLKIIHEAVRDRLRSAEAELETGGV